MIAGMLFGCIIIVILALVSNGTDAPKRCEGPHKWTRLNPWSKLHCSECLKEPGQE